jgi:hypothetical protein
MTIAIFLFGMIVSTLLGVLLHFWQGGSLGKMVFYILASWIGFWAGHGLDELLLKWHFLAVGPLNLGMALVVNILLLAIAYWLGLNRASQKD